MTLSPVDEENADEQMNLCCVPGERGISLSLLTRHTISSRMYNCRTVRIGILKGLLGPMLPYSEWIKQSALSDRCSYYWQQRMRLTFLHA